MLQSVTRISSALPIHLLSGQPAWNEHEPGRITAEQAAAEANVAKPLGAARATMAKINALAEQAEARAQPEQPAQPQASAKPAEQRAEQQAAQLQAPSPAPAPAPMAQPMPTREPRGRRLDLRA